MDAERCEPLTDRWIGRFGMKQLAREVSGRRDHDAAIDRLWSSMERHFADWDQVRFRMRALRVGYRKPDEGKPIFCVHASDLEPLVEMIRIYAAEDRLPAPRAARSAAHSATAEHAATAMAS